MAFLALPQPYDFELSTERFRTFGPDLANLWHEGGLHRVVGGRELRLEAAPGGVSVQDAEGLRGSEPRSPVSGGDVGRLLGLSHDLAGFTSFAAGHDVLAPLLARLRGFRPTLVPDGFEMLVTSVTAQQVSLRAAGAIRNRLVERFGRRGRCAWEFPAGDRLASASEGELVSLGFSRRKAEYVLGLARAGLDHDALGRLPDEEVKARLVELHGFGEWSADWYLARHLARPRAWPAGDLGLRRAAERFCAGGRPLTTADVRALAVDFAPFENLAAHHLLVALRVGPDPSESPA